MYATPHLSLLWTRRKGDIPHERVTRGRQSAWVRYFGVILYILYRANVVGVGKEPISSKSKLGNHCLNLILQIPEQVQYKFQATFKMIFLEKNALDCEILIGNRPSAFNKNCFSKCVPLHVFKWCSFWLNKCLSWRYGYYSWRYTIFPSPRT